MTMVNSGLKGLIYNDGCEPWSKHNQSIFKYDLTIIELDKNVVGNDGRFRLAPCIARGIARLQTVTMVTNKHK